MGKKSIVKKPSSSTRHDSAMGKKSTAKKPSSSTRHASTIWKFVDDDAEKRYADNIHAWDLVKEKGFLLHDSPTLGQPTFVSDVII